MTSEKFFFYASGRIHYYDSQRSVFSEDGAVVYDNSWDYQSKEHSGPSFHVGGELYWFYLEDLFSIDTHGVPYRVITWESSDPELFESLELASMIMLDTDGQSSNPQINEEDSLLGPISYPSPQTPQVGDSMDWSPAPSTIKSSTKSFPLCQPESPGIHTLFSIPESSIAVDPVVVKWGQEVKQARQTAATARPTRKPEKEPRRCPVCDKVFRRQCALEEHLRVHLDVKPYPCPFKDCHFRFATKSNIKRHFLTHQVGLVEEYRPDVTTQPRVSGLPGTLDSGETSSYDPEAFPNGGLRIPATELIDPTEQPGSSYPDPEALSPTSHQYSPQPVFGSSGMILSGASAEKRSSEPLTLEQIPLAFLSGSVDDEPIKLPPNNSGNEKKYYFHASSCFYYFDDHRKLYSNGGTLVYDGSGFQRGDYPTPAFNIDGVTCWFELDGLFYRGTDGTDYRVHTWQSNVETIASHMVTPVLSAGFMGLLIYPKSMQEMFHHLLYHGCVDLSSQMDSQQDNAMIINGGGFGDIWLGRLSNGTRVAIKAWRASVIEQCDYKALKHATREIYYWSKLKHENIHQLMGVIMFKGQYLGMVSQWMENGSLCAYMRINPHFDRHKMSVRIASGLLYMHNCNAVHGDLRTSNILISSNGDPKLTDFGLSTMSEAGLAFTETTNTQAGSMRWASPEQLLKGSPSSKTSDVYALGMTILEIFSGHVPYYPQCQKDFQVIAKLQQGILPARPTEHLKDDARGNQTWELLVRCWNRKSDDRPTAKEVLESLEAISST
ncbi:unnamed protein product [Rhizoctonia solani]|uniref:Non-specific protein-tyrosine kinase n=1 Tax=Rhizoctonia solani TaxID=456999 RepID=A0A8H3HH83_9AGAM|nr:unnamed protein product [Rhizoctonia solani]